MIDTGLLQGFRSAGLHRAKGRKNLWALGLLVLAGVLCAAPTRGVAEAPGSDNRAIVPAPRPDDWWKMRHENINARVQRGDVDIVFVGDSITQGWESSGRAVWEKYYGNRKIVNLGISGDQTQHVLWRLAHGNIDGIAPKVAVVMIGTNNSNGDDFSAGQIGEGVRAIVKLLRDKLPETRILLLGIFPRGEKPNPQREKLAAVNVIIARAADGKTVRYLDIGEKFLAADGSISKDIMPDLLHLSPQGYEIWAAAIAPALRDLLGEQRDR